MTQLEIGLTLTVAIFIVAIGTICFIWWNQVQKLTEQNEKLNRNLSAVRAANARQKQQNEINDIRHRAEMNRTLYMWREETDELRCMLAQKERLLQQKWAVAKDAVSD